MRIKCDRWCRNIARDCTDHDAELVLSGISDSHCLHLLDQQFSDFQLPRGTGISRRGLTGGRVDLYVLQKAVEQSCAVHWVISILVEMLCWFVRSWVDDVARLRESSVVRGE